MVDAELLGVFVLFAMLSAAGAIGFGLGRASGLRRGDALRRQLIADLLTERTRLQAAANRVATQATHALPCRSKSDGR